MILSDLRASPAALSPAALLPRLPLGDKARAERFFAPNVGLGNSLLHVSSLTPRLGTSDWHCSLHALSKNIIFVRGRSGKKYSTACSLETRIRGRGHESE